MEELIDNLEDPSKNKGKRNLFLIVFSIVGAVGNFIAACCAVVEIRSIIVSGFLLGGFFLVELIVALSLKKRRFWIHASCGIAAIVLVLLTINVFELTPERAKIKVPILLFVLAFLHFAYTLFVLIKEPQKRTINL